MLKKKKMKNIRLYNVYTVLLSKTFPKRIEDFIRKAG